MPIGRTTFDFISPARGLPSRRRWLSGSDNRDSFRSGPFRLAFFPLLQLAVFLFLLATLFKLMIFQGSYFRGLSNGNRIREVVIHAPRGIIYDRNGVALTSNLPAFRLVSCDSSAGNCKSQVISSERAIALEASGLSSGLRLEVDSSRLYVFGPATAHLLGYVSQADPLELATIPGLTIGDKLGRGGVEEKYENVLRGKNGKQLVEVDALGKAVRTLSTVPPIPGDDVHLTVDINVQKVAFAAISGQKAAVVVTDPRDLSVLALASGPSFDPNVFTDLSISPDEQAKKVEQILADSNQPLFDRAISGTYPPGSTFKIVTAAAGLASGKVTESTVIDDPGILVVGPYKFPNWKFLQDGGRQGVLNVVSAIKVSNDIFFYRAGEAVGVDDLGRWGQKMGVNQKLGIDLPGEATGSFPTASWREKFGRGWYLGDTYHVAIGQGDLLVTPLQDNAWISVVANSGKLCRPYVNSSLKMDCRSSGIDQKNLNLIKEGLVAACSPGGTAYPLFNFQVGARGSGLPASKQIQIACKTGTAEFGDPRGRTHAWLTSFAPADKPEIAVTVLIEGGGEGSDVAAPVVKKIMEEWFGR